MNHDHFGHDSEPKGFWGSHYSIGLIVMGAIAAYFLLTEHRAHLFAALPYLLFLACPLMHLFMHHGHGGQGGSQGHKHDGRQHPDNSAPPPPPRT